MKKTTKKVEELKVPIKRKGILDVKRDSPEHSIRQSINQKVERSEGDVKKSFTDVVTPLTVITCLTFLLVLTLVVR
jgi:hypothetical protein